MFFNSVEFLLFLPIVFVTYWFFFPKNVSGQNIIILFASYVFYGWWDWRFLSLIMFSTCLDFFLGIKIHSSKFSSKKFYLIISIVCNIGILSFFKYFNFFISSLQESFSSIGYTFDTWSLSIILPVGISFYTFQTLSYSFDIFNNNLKPTKDFISYSAFVSFFPQLVAGPIERAKNLLPQFINKRYFNSTNAINGCSLIVYGLFKKVVIADRLAIYVNSVFNDYYSYNSISLTLAVVFFAIQIYCDFSGYSLIARGTAKLFGFELMVNFNRPYFSQSITEFWRRWHISLSTWFRDYLYIPIGGNRISKKRTYINIMLVFVVSGLWHGANWTFVFWGFIHGFFAIVFLMFSNNSKMKNKNRFRKYLNILIVFIIVNFAWIFFRSENITHAFKYVYHILQFDFSYNLVEICAEKGPLNLFISLLSIFLLYLSYLLPKSLIFDKPLKTVIFNVVVLLLILVLGVNGEPEFIYFQF
tara:strand:+ start:179 stop:1594 length:1416 start_codon:yes stop_codon:yes gene_type:complete